MRELKLLDLTQVIYLLHESVPQVFQPPSSSPHLLVPTLPMMQFPSAISSVLAFLWKPRWEPPYFAWKSNRQNALSWHYSWWNSHNQGHRLVLFITEAVQVAFFPQQNKWNKRREDKLWSMRLHTFDLGSLTLNLWAEWNLSELNMGSTWAS